MLSSCLDLRTAVPDTSGSGSVLGAQTLISQQAIKTESPSTNGAVVKDEAPLAALSTKAEGSSGSHRLRVTT